MTPLDYTCSHFDAATNTPCMALPGEMCVWLDEKGMRYRSPQCHPERVEAAKAMNAASGDAPTAAAFEHAVDAEFGGLL